MKKLFFVFFVLLVSAAFVMAGGQQEGGQQGGMDEAAEMEMTDEPVEIALWTQEGEAENAFQFVEKLAEQFMDMHDNVTIDVLNKETEALREDFLTASLAGDPPDLVWTVNDHAGPFVAANLLKPVQDLFDMDEYVESVSMGGDTWAVPISSGNHLMLMYNTDIVSEPPETTEELIEMGQELTGDDRYGLVYNATEPFWLAPWLGGFDGTVFAEDGVTPTLDTQAMRDTLQFLYDLEFEHGIVPAESDYATMDTLFKEGNAAMIINGDWAIGGYRDAMGDDFAVTRIPQVSATGEWPKPYTSGKYFMIPRTLEGNKLATVVEFIEYATNYENQIDMVETLSRLPARREALSAEEVTSDELLAASAQQMEVGTPMPSAVEMRAIWDAIKPEMNAVLADNKSPEAAAEAMQKAAEQGIQDLQ
ncbi:MAG: extracellular solute-binding protein [Spirochaetaceae bacterium]